jgi:RNA polymerase sigma-70 factor (ECF subfamily)
LHRYDHKQSFTTWLFVIGRRLAANEKRRIGRHRKREAELEVPHEVDAIYPEFDSGSIWAAAKNILPENSYATMWLHYGENQSVKEIAQILGKSVTGVKVTLHRARRTLASELDPDLVGERID